MSRSMLMLGLSVLISCKNKSNNSTEQKIKIPVITIQSRSLSLDQLYVTDIRAIRNVELRSKISGFLDAIYVDEGQNVKKGQLLFKISDGEYKSDVAKAAAVLDNANAETKISQLEYERVKMLVTKNIVSKTDIDLAAAKLSGAKAKADQAEAELQNMKNRLCYTKIYAPFDGIVDRIHLRAGSLLSEGSLITSVSDITTMYAYFDISENEYLSYTRTQAKDTTGIPQIASLLLSDGAAYEHKGKIETVVSEFDENTGSISIRASFPNPEHILKHKATGKVKLITNVTDALLVPQKAVFEIQDKNYVYTIDNNNVVKMKSFVPARRTEEFYIVKSGLQKGEQVVYEGIQDLKEGMHVVPQVVSYNNQPLTSVVTR